MHPNWSIYVLQCFDISGSEAEKSKMRLQWDAFDLVISTLN